MIESLGVGATAGGLVGALVLARAPRRRLLLGLAAAALALAAMLGPLGARTSTLLSAHMLQHVLIGDAVPLLVVLAFRGEVAAALPRPPAAVLRLLDRLVRPAPVLALWAGAVALWHVPALYDAALRIAPLHALEHGSFAAGGLLVWSLLLDPLGRGLLPGWRRFAFGLGILAASQALANVLVLSYRPLYPAYASGSSPLHDQDAAGVVMMLEQLSTLGTFLVLTARRLLDARPAAAEARHPLAA